MNGYMMYVRVRVHAPETRGVHTSHIVDMLFITHLTWLGRSSMLHAWNASNRCDTRISIIF